MLGARDNIPITLDSDASITETELFDQHFDGCSDVHGSRLTVDDDVDRCHCGADPTTWSQGGAAPPRGCDDHDIRAVVTIGFVKPKSQEKGVGGMATPQNYAPDGVRWGSSRSGHSTGRESVRVVAQELSP